MGEWILEINRKLTSLESTTRIVVWYGHTGNFVVESSRADQSAIAGELTSLLGVSCAVLPFHDALDITSTAEKAPSPPSLEGKRWTGGIVFAVRSQPCRSVPKQTSHAVFFPISENAVGAWKEDQLTPGATLDRERRGGGWGAVSGDVSKAVGGVWTAHSLRTVIGTLEKARLRTEQ